MTIFARNMPRIAHALSGPIWNLKRQNPVFGTGYTLDDKDSPNDTATIYLTLLDGPSVSGSLVKTITASSDKTDDGAYIADIVKQFEQQIFDLQDYKPKEGGIT